MPGVAIFRVVWLTTCLWAPAVAKDSCPAIPKRAKGLQQWAVKHAGGVFEELKADMNAVEAAVVQHGSITIGATGRLEVSDRVLVHVLSCADLGFVVRQVYRNQIECDGTSAAKTCYVLLPPDPETPESLLIAVIALDILDPAHKKMAELKRGKRLVWCWPNNEHLYCL